MISTGRKVIFDQWWVATMPGFAIFIVCLGFTCWETRCLTFLTRICGFADDRTPCCDRRPPGVLLVAKPPPCAVCPSALTVKSWGSWVNPVRAKPVGAGADGRSARRGTDAGGSHEF